MTTLDTGTFITSRFVSRLSCIHPSSLLSVRSQHISNMPLHGEGIAGVIFLTLYTGNLCLLLFGFFTRRIHWKSVYSFLLFHVLLRLGAQSTSIAIGTQDSLDVGLLIAFFVLGAEGYFSLVLCTYRFTIHHHQYAYPISGSWLEGKPHKTKSGKQDPWYKRFKRAMTAKDAEGKSDPWVMTIIHWCLIGVRYLSRSPQAPTDSQANVIIIVGGTRVTASEVGESDYWKQFHTAQGLRAAGQAVFLIINILLASFLYLSIKQDRNPDGTIPAGLTRFFRVDVDHGAADARERGGAYSPTTTSPVLRILVIAWPPLIIRGVFGLLQALVPGVNYSHPASYRGTPSGSGFEFTVLFTVMESVFAVLPEWTACCLLCCTLLTAEGNLKIRKEREGEMILSRQGSTAVEA